MDKNIGLALIGLLIAITLGWASLWVARHRALSKPEALPSSLTLFYSTRCTHCLAVEKYLKQHHLEERVVTKEVSQGGNAALLFAAAKQCMIPGNEIGVPVLWDGHSECHIGDTAVIAYLEERFVQTS